MPGTVTSTRTLLGTTSQTSGPSALRKCLRVATWTPPVPAFDLVFVDGCHEASAVYRDSLRALALLRPGGLLLWHDFAPGLRRVHPWLRDVAQGIEWLYAERRIAGPIYRLADSWTGIYRVPPSR